MNLLTTRKFAISLFSLAVIAFTACTTKEDQKTSPYIISGKVEMSYMNGKMDTLNFLSPGPVTKYEVRLVDNCTMFGFVDFRYKLVDEAYFEHITLATGVTHFRILETSTSH